MGLRGHPPAFNDNNSTTEAKGFIMMVQRKRLHPIGLVAAVAMLFAGAGASAQNEQANTQYKIAVVDLKAVFEAYERQKVEYVKLEAEKKSRQVEIDALSTKIENAKKQYEAKKGKMTDEELEDLEEDIQSDYGKYQAEFNRQQGEIDRREKKLLDDLFADIRTAVTEVGTQGNYHLILEGGTGGPTSVLYSSTTLNITSRVIEHLNGKYKKS